MTSSVYSTNTLTSSLIRGINQTQNQLDRSFERLSTGLRVNSNRDDPSSIPNISRAASQISSLSAASKNASAAMAQLTAADSALNEVSEMILRIKDLAIRASSAAITTTDRTAFVDEAALLTSEIESISTRVKSNGRTLLDGSYGGIVAQVGTQAFETISMSISSASPSSIGTYLSTGPTRDALTAAQTATANTTTTSEDIVLTANQASTTIDVAANDSAKTVAAKVNAISDSTLVSAEAVTFASLFSTNASSANYTVSINGTSTSAFAISSSDVTDAVSKINLISATTGVTASATAANKVLLQDATGDDITIENAGAGSDLDVQAIQSDGSTTQGSAVSLGVGASSNNDATRVIGTLRLFSHASFSVSQSGNTSLGYATTETPSLSSLASIDLSSAVSAGNSLSTVDGAIEQLSMNRGRIGATQSRLGFADSLLSTQTLNASSRLGELQDADYAMESAALAKTMVLQQINTALLAQANASSELVIKLIESD